MMTEKTFSTEWINERNRSLARAGEGIVAARKSLDQLEKVLMETTSGQFPDIGQVAGTTHRLREEINQILIGLVESSMVKRDGRCSDGPIQQAHHHDAFNLCGGMGRHERNSCQKAY